MKPLSITFLGTCSGGGPLLSRACSSTMLNIDHAQWCQFVQPNQPSIHPSIHPYTDSDSDSLQHSTVIDCAEGTQIQLKRARFKPELISKVFITHMHSTLSVPLSPSCDISHLIIVDHVMGLLPLMRTVMNKDEPTSTVGPFTLLLMSSFLTHRSGLGCKFMDPMVSVNSLGSTSSSHSPSFAADMPFMSYWDLAMNPQYHAKRIYFISMKILATISVPTSRVSGETYFPTGTGPSTLARYSTEVRTPVQLSY